MSIPDNIAEKDLGNNDWKFVRQIIIENDNLLRMNQSLVEENEGLRELLSYVREEIYGVFHSLDRMD